eukprot:symbB.v1.2.036554.t1/scaffold5179.1/size30116/3
MSDDEEKETCVVVLIGNDDEDLELARACARHLYDVLNHTRMFSGRPVCGAPIFLPDKCDEEIMEGIQEAVQRVKENGASWLIIYYAGHAFWDDESKEILIKPKLADGDGIWLKKQVKKTVEDAELEYIKTTIFMDSCLEEPLEQLDAAKGDNQPGDSKKLAGNKFEVVQCCKEGKNIRDGWLFARAIERCAQKPLVDQLSLVSHVEELAWQLSFHRLCPRRSGMDGLEGINDMVLTEKQRNLFQKTHFLRFALDLWTEDKLELDPKKDWLELEGSDIKETVKFLKRIVKEFEAKRAAFEKPWCELEAIVKCYSLNHFEEYLKKLEIPVRDVSELDPENVLIPENVRRAIVEVLQEKVPKVDPENPKFTENGDPDFDWEGLHTLRGLMQDLVLWYKKWEPQASETGISFLLDEEKKDKKAYSVVVKDLDVENLQESERNELADEINRLCKDLGIPGQVYLVRGSLWIIFCLKDELSRDCRRKFAEDLKSWIGQQKQSGANGYILAQDPCWKPLYAVPDRILDLVRQVETLCATCLPTKPMWLRASDLRNLVAETMRERKLEEWRIVVFEGLMERRGDSWLQGTGTLGCCFLPHFEDERLDHRMQEIANLTCKRKQSMRPEVQALVFLLKRAQLELTDEEWTQVVDSARVCYEHLKTLLCKLMLDKDTDATQPTNFLVIGNPGTGKSTILNGLIGEAIFKSGISYGKGMTFQFDKHKVGMHTYMDTPGLAHPELRKQAAAAITEALKQEGYYKIFFVVTLQNGLVKAEDVTTMKLMLDAAPISDFGIIINQVPPKQYRDLTENPKGEDPPPVDKVCACLTPAMRAGKASLMVHLMQRDEELEGEDNIVKQLPDDFHAFVQTTPGMVISAKSVQKVSDQDFEELQKEMETKLNDLGQQNASMQEALKKQDLQVADLKDELVQQRADMEQALNKAADAEAKLERMYDIFDDSGWQHVGSGPVKDSENPSGSNVRDAAAAATAANNSSGSDDQVAQVFPRAWNSGLNHIADQQVWSPSASETSQNICKLDSPTASGRKATIRQAFMPFNFPPHPEDETLRRLTLKVEEELHKAERSNAPPEMRKKLLKEVQRRLHHDKIGGSSEPMNWLKAWRSRHLEWYYAPHAVPEADKRYLTEDTLTP